MPIPIPRAIRLETIPIDALRLDPKNPRRHPKHQIKMLARSMESIGFVTPLVVDRENNLLAGHGRAMAARSVGMTHVPAVRVESLTEAQAKAFRVADNRLAEHASWDETLLGEVLRDLVSLDLDFSIEDTGFSIAEIDLRIAATATEMEKGPDPDDLFAESEGAAAVTVAGDLWQVGRHRVGCLDAREPASYRSLMLDESAKIVFTDAPYNVPIDGHVSGKGAIRHREFAMASGELSARQFVRFLAGVFEQLCRASTDGSLHYHCMDWRHAREILEAGADTYTELKNICVWVKKNGGMGSLYRSQHELVFVFKNGRAAHRNNVELGRFGRYRTNVWTYAGMNDFRRESEEGNLLKAHPTVKPVSLVADALLDTSARGEVVLDPFLGSGTTLIAAERTGRTCYGLEIDPLYVDTIIRRWQRYSGEIAMHAASGKSFDALANERVLAHE